MRWLPLLLLSLTATASAQTCEAPLNVRDWSHADAHALAASDWDAASLDRLARYLSRAGRTEAEKTRAAFRWIAAHIAYDVDAPVSRARPNQSADSTLARREGVCEGYSRLLVSLLERMGVESRFVGGWGLSAGEAAISPDGLHAWVAARVDGHWVLMDPTWAAGIVQRDQFSFRFNGQWFASPPDWFARRHIPEDERWQLLETPLSLEDAVARRIPAAQCRSTPAETARRHSTATTVRAASNGPAWREVDGIRYRIHTPGDTRSLTPRSRVSVRVEAPDAYAVAVFDGSLLATTLRSSGDEWNGQARVGDHPFRIGIQSVRGGPWRIVASWAVTASR